ncbi:MAG: GNAT family N-acetyltransferase [Trebonia sp.]
MDTIQLRELGPADDHGQLLDLKTRAFGLSTPPERDRWLAQTRDAIARRAYLAAFDGHRLAAAARFHDLTQWWLGCGVPAAGVASVAVAPEDRGKGVGRALMTALLDQIAVAGYPLSVLYPATVPLYRSLGWEIAGLCYEARLPARSLRTITPGPAGTDALGRATPDDAGAVRAVHSAVHAQARDCGPLTWDEATIRQWLDTEGRFSYLGADGFAAYRWQDGNNEILVERAIAGSQATMRDIWSLLASSSSIASTVAARVSPAEPFGIMMREAADAVLTSVHPWMLRVVDAPAAVAGRGFPAGLEITVPLRLLDTGRPGNAGDWLLAVSGGKGTFERSQPAAAAALSLDVRGFAALYAGTTVPVLRRSGLASGGDPGADALLDAAFAAQPFCLDTF